jgi:hypothetical protein
VDRGPLRRAAIVLALAGLFALIYVERVPICPMASVLGLPCPGCGLTRATFALVRGDLREALHLHPLVWLISPIFGWAVASAAYGFIRGPRANTTLKPWLDSRWVTALALGVLALTLGVWAARFGGYFGGPAPVETFRDFAQAHFR